MKFPQQSSQFIEQGVDFAQWQRQLVAYRDFFSKQNQQRWLLFVEDSYQFSLLFFALIAAKKQLILPPNGQPLQVKQCMAHADIFIGDLDGEADTDLDYPRFDIEQLAGIDMTSHDELSFDLHSKISFFTSGSSGQAKAIEKSFGQLVTEVEQLEQTFTAHFADNCIVMATVSHQHIYGLLFKLLWPLWAGRDLYLKTFAYPEHLVHQVKQTPNASICLISSPAYYHRLLADNVLADIKSQLSVLFSSGGPLNAQAAIDLQQSLGITPIEVYGSTETGGIAWRQRQSIDDDIWQVFSAIQCHNDDSEQRLSILSPYVDSAHWYRTDDRVELLDKQRFKLLGRADRIVKIEEKRCSLDEIGLRLVEHSFVEQAYVLVVGDADKRRTLAAVVELTEAGQEALATSVKFKFDRLLKAHLKQYFEAIVIPRKFRYLTQLPFNSQGKLNKKHLETLFD
ncbi:AMP-binding protein [Litorilituus sediminis]|uniref:Acyl-CoA synthetase n=1 Tax=Litorilituus sediminis TaxID=718192 RepID=A0A4P6P5R8_9GAMM|nr:AMP-binding protein [Litorilituus sediminis]QBG37016.1 acyl-CoA synthetase [Litorilituus sediminis]